MHRILAVILLCAGIFCLAQSNAQVPMTGAGLGAPASGGGGACSQYTALAARLDGGQNASATQTLICGLVSDGNWTGVMDLFYVFATNSTANALLNWVSSSFTLSVTGNPLNFTANQGYASPGTGSFLDTTYTPSSSATNCSQNSCAFGYYDRSSRSSGSSKDFGAITAGGDIFLDTYFSGTLFNDVNDTSFNSVSTTNAQGQYVSSRTSSGSLSLYKNSSSTDLGPFTSASVGLPTASLYITCINNAGCDTGTPDQIAVVFVGKGLSGANAASVMTRINTYMTTLGTNVY